MWKAFWTYCHCLTFRKLQTKLPNATQVKQSSADFNDGSSAPMQSTALQSSERTVVAPDWVQKSNTAAQAEIMVLFKCFDAVDCFQIFWANCRCNRLTAEVKHNRASWNQGSFQVLHSIRLLSNLPSGLPFSALMALFACSMAVDFFPNPSSVLSFNAKDRLFIVCKVLLRLCFQQLERLSEIQATLSLYNLAAGFKRLTHLKK